MPASCHERVETVETETVETKHCRCRHSGNSNLITSSLSAFTWHLAFYIKYKLLH